MMETKPIVIGGGIAAVFLLVLIAYKKSNKAAQENSSPITSPDVGYFSGVIPQSSGAVFGSITPSDDANSGSTNTGGGFDISNLLTNILTGQSNNTASQIISNAHIADSAILAGINFGSAGGTASVSHSDTGTILNVVKTAPSLSSTPYSYIAPVVTMPTPSFGYVSVDNNAINLLPAPGITANTYSSSSAYQSSAAAPTYQAPSNTYSQQSQPLPNSAAGRSARYAMNEE